MTAPVTGPQGVRLCARDGFALELDRELAQACVDAGWPAVELLRCKNGHSVRADAPHLRTGPKPPRPPYLCPACGKPVPRGKGSSRKMCSDPCSRFVAERRSYAYQRGEVFVLEAQTWYRGAVTAYRQPEPLPPLDPLVGRIPRAWADGWLVIHGGAVGESAA